MKVDGVHGDFIVYDKPQDKECSVRISFMKCEKQDSLKCKAQKVKLRKTMTENNGKFGYALDSIGFIKWFDTMPELVDYYKNDPVHPFKRPYFYSGVDIKQPSPILPARNTLPSVPSPSINRPKPKFPTLERSDAPNDPRPTDLSLRDKQKNKKHVSERLNVRVSEKSISNSGSDSDADDFKPSPSNSLPPKIFPNLESPTIKDHPNVKSLLDGKPEGYYVIHKDKNRNTATNPYSIYAVKQSKRTGDNRVQTAQIHFDTFSQHYLVGSKPYPTLDAFLENNTETLKFNVKFDRPHYIDPREIREGSEGFKPPKDETPYIEHYKR